MTGGSGPGAEQADATGAGLAAFIADVAADVAAAAETLNQLDAIAGDGDLGVTASLAAAALANAARQPSGLPPSDVVRRCGQAVARGAPSTAGTLIAFALMAAGNADPGPDEPIGRRIAVGLDAAAAAIAEHGRVGPGDKTMLDAALPAAAAFRSAIDGGDVVAVAIRNSARAADAGAIATTTMRATTGRAGWLADRSQGSEDAGARLVAIALDAAAARLQPDAEEPVDE